MLKNLNLAGRIVGLVICAVLVTAAALWISTSRELAQQLEIQRYETSNDHIRALGVVFGDRVPGARVRVEGETGMRAETASLVEFGDHYVVDTTSLLTGGVATVFAFDPEKNNFIRKSTTLRKEDGERAMGTWLANDHPAQALVREGKRYAGPATLFGREYMTVYQPTVDPFDKVNGILFIGMPMEKLMESQASANRAMLIAAILVAFGVTIAAVFIARKMFRPLGDIAARVSALAQGDLTSEIAHRGRADEIGAVARALEVLRDTKRRRRRCRTSGSRRRSTSSIVVKRLMRRSRNSASGPRACSTNSTST